MNKNKTNCKKNKKCKNNRKTIKKYKGGVGIKRKRNNNNNNNNNECPICLETISKQNRFTTSCNHNFHKNCMREMIIQPNRNLKKCPMCRTNINSKNISNLGITRENMLRRTQNNEEQTRAAIRNQSIIAALLQERQQERQQEQEQDQILLYLQNLYQTRSPQRTRTRTLPPRTRRRTGRPISSQEQQQVRRRSLVFDRGIGNFVEVEGPVYVPGSNQTNMSTWV